MTFTLDSVQKSIVEADGSFVVLGGAGSGKTFSLLRKVEALVESGVLAEQIAVVDFSHQSKMYLQKSLQKVKSVRIESFRSLAQGALEASGEKVEYPTDRQMRRILSQAMKEIDFPGSVLEAEHVLRKFKSRARKPHENERFYLLFQCYKSKCAFDRFDVVRKHLLDMRSGQSKPVDVQYIFVDNFQDVNQIQLLWLIAHIEKGVKVCVFGDDDLQMMTLDGSLGRHAFDDFVEVDDVSQFTLEQNYRHASNLQKSFLKCLFPIKERLPKKQSFVRKGKGFLEPQLFDSFAKEDAYILNQVKAYSVKGRVAVLVRDDWQALCVHHLLSKNAIPHTCFANNLWETPGAIMVHDLLHVLLNRSQDLNLRNAMLGFGLNVALVDAFFSAGLNARDWLKNGGQLPLDIELPTATLKEYSAMQRQFQAYYKMMLDRTMSPQDAFKALCYDYLVKMNESDRKCALLALDTLLSMGGDLFAKLEEIRAAKLFDVSARVVVAPVRYIRNMEFDTVLMARCMSSEYPKSGLKALGVDVNHNRRLFYMGLSRAKDRVFISAVGTFSPYIQEVVLGYKESEK